MGDVSVQYKYCAMSQEGKKKHQLRGIIQNHAELGIFRRQDPARLSYSEGMKVTHQAGLEHKIG